MKEVELQDITFNYKEGKETVFKDFNISFEKGGFFFILGSNGSGKSTLLKLILGAVVPRQGKVLFNGSALRNHQQRTRHIGYVPQDLSLDPEMSVSDIMDFMASCHQLSRESYLVNRSFLVNALDISDLVHKRIKTLSGGQKQKVNIALGLIHGPEVILLDEPFTGLDYYTSVKVLTGLLTLKKTIICITHDIDLAEQYATEVVVMKNGKILDQGMPADIVRQRPFMLQELDFKKDVVDENFEFSGEIKYAAQQNRLILSYPDGPGNNEEVAAFKSKYSSEIIRSTSFGNNLKSSIVGLHDISLHKDKPEVSGKKKQGGGDGSGSGGGKGGGKGRKS